MRKTRKNTLVEDIALIIALALALIAAALTMPVKSLAREEPPPTLRNGELRRVPNSSVKLAYAMPGTNWSKYKTIELRTLEVPAEARNAAGNRTPRLRENYMLGDKEVQALQQAYADSMKKVLGDAGFTFVDTPQDDTLVIAAQITRIELNAPLESSRTGYSGRSRTYTQGSGAMWIAAVFGDAQSGRVIAEAADARSASNSLWNINNRVTNMADARQIFSAWARNVRSVLGR